MVSACYVVPLFLRSTIVEALEVWNAPASEGVYPAFPANATENKKKK